jgi:hypothetical protein
MILSLLDAVFSDQNKDFAESARIPLSNNLTEYSQYATKVSTLQGQLDAFHVLLEEISTSRDDALLREKRIRRYLLRIMAGQAKEDVLRVSFDFFALLKMRYVCLYSHLSPISFACPLRMLN